MAAFLAFVLILSKIIFHGAAGFAERIVRGGRGTLWKGKVASATRFAPKTNIVTSKLSFLGGNVSILCAAVVQMNVKTFRFTVIL